MVRRIKNTPSNINCYTNIDKDRSVYPLNRDFLASSRLHLQHQLWVASLGYLLHPNIPLKENLIVADIGCGSGISSHEIARQLPSGGKVEASDSSLAQCPPRGWWPENVTIDELDIFEATPQQLVERLDIVYIRHFICVVQSGSPRTLLTALLRLLKPGGHIQWQEWDLETNKRDLADSAASAPKMKAYMNGTRGPASLENQISWVKNFHTCLSDTVAEVMVHDRRWTGQEYKMIKQEISFWVAREWCDNLRARDLASSEAERLEVPTSEAIEECLKLQWQPGYADGQGRILVVRT